MVNNNHKHQKFYEDKMEMKNDKCCF